MNGTRFVGERLETARDFYGKTLRDLAETVSASPSALSLIETGQKHPPDDLVRAMAEALNVAPEFFFTPLDDIWRDEECSFRHRRTTPEKVKQRARAHGTLVGVVIEHLSKPLRFPRLDVPEFAANSIDDVERAAEEARRHWKLGLDAPILQPSRVLERAGILLVQHLEHSDKIDAFSRRGRRSVVVLNTARKSTSRWIFDVSHELGHFVLHRGIRTGSEDTESQADRFGGAFLMPRRAFMREYGRGLSWPRIWSLKQRWLASASAIVRRAYQLDLMGAIDYRRANKYLSAHYGAKRREPHEPEFTGPELLPMALRTLEEKQGVSVQDVCRQLHFKPTLFGQVVGIAADDLSARIRKNLVTVLRPRA